MRTGVHASSRRSSGASARGQRRDRALTVVAVAAIRRQISQRRARAAHRRLQSAAAAGTHSGLTGWRRRSSTSVRSVTMSGSAAPHAAPADRGRRQLQRVNPRISVRRESWHARQSATRGMLWNFPGAISATSGTPSGGASTASVCSSFHTYDAKTQRSAARCQRKRVSTAAAELKSFQNRVPTGKSQRSTLVVSIVAPSGSGTQRRLLAPSLQSGYCGENGRLRGPPSACRVRDRARSATGGAAPAAPPATELWRPDPARASRPTRQDRRGRQSTRHEARRGLTAPLLPADRSAAARGSSSAAATAGRRTRLDISSFSRRG